MGEEAEEGAEEEAEEAEEKEAGGTRRSFPDKTGNVSSKQSSSQATEVLIYF